MKNGKIVTFPLSHAADVTFIDCPTCPCDGEGVSGSGSGEEEYPNPCCEGYTISATLYLSIGTKSCVLTYDPVTELWYGTFEGCTGETVWCRYGSFGCGYDLLVSTEDPATWTTPYSPPGSGFDCGITSAFSFFGVVCEPFTGTANFFDPASGNCFCAGAGLLTLTITEVAP